MLDRYQMLFDRARKRILSEHHLADNLTCKSGLWPEGLNPQCVVLKLFKPHWSNDDNKQISSHSEIFFSIWIDINQPGQLHYNIHALKLRQLRGYALESRKFAKSFRQAFTRLGSNWPNLSLDYGPQTLMQGFDTVDFDACEDKIVDWAGRFQPVSALIDDQLALSKR